MNGNELVDRLLELTGDTSDAKLAMRLGMVKQEVSRLRREEQALSPERARRIAIILGEDPRNVLAWQAAWKAKDAGTRDYWLKASAMVIFCMAILLPIQDAAAQNKTGISPSIHYAKL